MGFYDYFHNMNNRSFYCNDLNAVCNIVYVDIYYNYDGYRKDNNMAYIYNNRAY